MPDLAQTTGPLRALLQKGVAFVWTPEHEQAFNAAKECLTSPLVVKPFNPKLPLELLTDASRLHGLGYMLLQKENDSSHRMIRCGSRSLTPAESRYAVIELECLAARPDIFLSFI